MYEFMEKVGDFLLAISVAEDNGEHEFKCPLCGGDVRWESAPGNGHLAAACSNCNFNVVE